MKAILPLSLALAALQCSAVAAPTADPARRAPPSKRYTLSQATSEKAQLHTLAFDGLAFLTSTYFDCTFIPPGKVCDYFGFQYMRDIDASTLGHNTDFLGRISGAVLDALDEEQTAQLVKLAEAQAPQFTELAKMRLPLVAAFCQLRDGTPPLSGATLDAQAIEKASADIWELDGKLSLERAAAFGSIARSLTAAQKDKLALCKFGDSSTWPPHGEGKGGPRLARPVKVALMTYASEFFSWLYGSVEADVYFCPERHATYFGSFYIKDAPVMGKRNATISTSLTGDAGAEFLETLTAGQRASVKEIVDVQRPDLLRIVEIRRAISAELRRALDGAAPDAAIVLKLSREYGACDARISMLYAERFAAIAQALTETQRARLTTLRGHAMHAGSAHDYSRETGDSELPPTKHLFVVRQ